MNDPVRLEALETLDAIERHGSFAAAAAALYRVPSAVSYTVSQLESDLGIAVFDHSGHRAVLTPAGRLLLDEGRRILTASRKLGAAARRLANHWEPKLRITLDASVPPATIWPILADFTREHPEIDVRIEENVLAGSWEALLEHRVDLAIGVTDPPAHSGVRRARYTNVAFVFCVAPSHPLTQCGRTLCDDDIRAWRALVVADSARQFARRDGHLLDGQPRLTVASMASKIAAIRAGLGVGYCPRAWVDADIEAGRLAALPTRGASAPRESYLLWHRGDIGRALAWFLDRLGALDQLSGT